MISLKKLRFLKVKNRGMIRGFVMTNLFGEILSLVFLCSETLIGLFTVHQVFDPKQRIVLDK